MRIIVVSLVCTFRGLGLIDKHRACKHLINI
jgi:hypothetical protein